MEELRLSLQLFAEEEEQEDDYQEEEYEEVEGEYEEGEEEDEGSKDDQTLTLTQREFDEKIKQLTAKERTKLEKRLSKLFGTKDLESAANYYKAGFAVSQASQKTPQEVIQRVQGRANTGNPGNPGTTGTPGSGSDHLQQEINEIKGILSEEREEKATQQQEKEARKEFGKLYDESKEDIQEIAEDKGLSLVEAASIVLRPRMAEVIEERQRAKKNMQKRRKVESSSEAPAKGDKDFGSKLSNDMKRAAQRMGLSYKEYYNHAKHTGLITDK